MCTESSWVDTYSYRKTAMRCGLNGEESQENHEHMRLEETSNARSNAGKLQASLVLEVSMDDIDHIP